MFACPIDSYGWSRMYFVPLFFFSLLVSFFVLFQMDEQVYLPLKDIALHVSFILWVFDSHLKRNKI